MPRYIDVLADVPSTFAYGLRQTLKEGYGGADFRADLMAGLVVAFEPNPRNFELLQANVWRNGLSNVVCFPWAVADKPGFAQLYLSADNSGDHRIYEHEQGRASTTVRVAALDALEVLRPPFDVVKIDVQGSEQGVFRGAERLFAASPGALLAVEFAPNDLRAFGDEPRPLLDHYRSLGYTIRVQHS